MNSVNLSVCVCLLMYEGVCLVRYNNKTPDEINPCVLQDKYKLIVENYRLIIK